MRTIAFLSIIQATALLALGTGCTSPSAGRNAGIQSGLPLAQPAKPGPVKQFADKISQSSFGKSVSNAFHLASDKKPKPQLRDPVSLAEKPKPPDADWYVSLGDLRVQEHDTAGAREMYHKALSMKANHLGALLGLARLFDRQGQLDRATEHYLRATKHHPKEAMAFNDLALCYARQGKYDEAIAALNRAIELQPDRTLYRNNIATVFIAQGRTDEALAHLTDAHGSAVAHYNVGYLLNKRGKQREALQQFELALQADPKLEAAQEWAESLTAQLHGEPEAPYYTASQTAPPAASASTPQGPSLTPPSEPNAGEFAAEEGLPATTDESGNESRDEPFNALRSATEPDPASEPQPTPDAQPQSATPLSPAEPDKPGKRGAEPSGIENDATQATAGQYEARLQYLPPVSSRATRPSRY